MDAVSHAIFNQNFGIEGVIGPTDCKALWYTNL